MLLKPKELGPLVRLINHTWAGDLTALSTELDKIIYMLHYLPPESFAERERQEVCFTLHRLKESFYKTYQKRKTKKQ